MRTFCDLLKWEALSLEFLQIQRFSVIKMEMGLVGEVTVGGEGSASAEAVAISPNFRAMAPAGK